MPPGACFEPLNGPPYTAFRILCGALMVGCVALGTGLLAIFLSNTLLPNGMQLASAALPTNYWGYYMMGFAGALLLAWGAVLAAATRTAAPSRGIGTATAFGLAANAVFRMIAWFSGEYAEVGNVPRVEAAIFLLLALGFLWLRPPEEAERRTTVP